MRQNPNSRRSRGRGGRKPGGNNRNQIFDSNGPGARVRGNSAQIYEKYQQLARDASSAGDRVAAENFYQHAEHYYRLMDAAGLNRPAATSDDSQQQQQQLQDGAPRNGDATDGATANAEPQAAPTSEAAPAENTPKPAQPAAADSSEQDDLALPASIIGAGGGQSESKPARRPRNRRSNGAANGRNTKQAEASPEAEAPAAGEPVDAPADKPEDDGSSIDA